MNNKIYPFLLLLAGTFCTHTLYAQSDTFYVNGNHIYDPCGNLFVPRGINYSVLDDGDFPGNLITGGEFSTQIRQAHPNIARVTWWINYAGGPRSAYSLSDLDSVITRFANDSIVVYLSIVDMTGYSTGPSLTNFIADTAKFRDSVVNWWISAPVTALVQKHKSTLIVNIANEWGSVQYNDAPATALAIFETVYINAVRSMRAAGITVPLVIDGPDYAGNIPEITAAGAALEAADPLHSIILAAHAYWATASTCVANDTAAIRSKLLQLDTVSYPVIIEETANWSPSCDGDTQCAYPININFLLTVCQQYNMGWLDWEWYDDCDSRQMTNDGTFAHLDGIGDTIVNNPVYGLATHAIKPGYMLNGLACAVTSYVPASPVTTTSVNIYPNPNNGDFTLLISSSTNEEAMVTITDMLGRKISEYTVPVNKPFDIQLDKTAGIYFLSATTAQGRYAGKVEVNNE